jgi:hypothetical protein
MLGKSRGQKKAEGKLGYIAGADRQLNLSGDPSSQISEQAAPQIGRGGDGKIKMCRRSYLHVLNSYYDDVYYDGMLDWKEAAAEEEPPSIYKRKPYLRYNLLKLFSSRVSAKLFGADVWPDLNIEDDPNSEMYYKTIIKESMLQSALLSGGKRLPLNGSMLVRFYIASNTFVVESFNANYCYPSFGPAKELLEVEIRYVYVDEQSFDKDGNPIRRWYRAILGQQADVLFDAPEYKPDVEPVFTPVQVVEHGLGFVQAEWFKTDDVPNYIDGPSLMGDVVPFLDPINYSLTLSQESTDYNTAPQLGVKGVDEDDVEALKRSNSKAWTLGKNGEAQFIESDMGGVEMSMSMRDKNKTFAQDLTRVTLLDPEKIVGSAQSGKAMEILHGPLVELISELRPQAQKHIKSITIKMAAANLIWFQQSGAAPVLVPQGWFPSTTDFSLNWPPVFPLTTQDKQQLVSLVVAAVNGNVISRRTGVKNLAPYFGVEDVEAELQEIVSQPQLSAPFGAF